MKKPFKTNKGIFTVLLFSASIQGYSQDLPYQSHFSGNENQLILLYGCPLYPVR
ncbi:MAG: hypothetical protein NTV31_14120 [Bacteroidia bacterium]|nr:hypothetical protein [Bacteroidia bacterium]